MARFQSQKPTHAYRRLILSLALFFALLCLFYAGLDMFSASTRERQRESLEAAIANGIAYCYAMDGVYPESLEVLEARCGLTYDKDHFFVDYHVTGANLLPDVTVIEKED